MNVLTEMVADLVIVAVIASFCEMLLPDTGVKRPVQLVFGLYFMALMLNPLVALVTDTDLSAMDFDSLGEASLREAEAAYDENTVYRQAAADLGADLESLLEQRYEGSDAAVRLAMDEGGFREATVRLKGYGGNPQTTAMEIQDLLIKEYGIPKDVIRIQME